MPPSSSKMRLEECGELWRGLVVCLAQDSRVEMAVRAMIKTMEAWPGGDDSRHRTSQTSLNVCQCLVGARVSEGLRGDGCNVYAASPA